MSSRYAWILAAIGALLVLFFAQRKQTEPRLQATQAAAALVAEPATQLESLPAASAPQARSEAASTTSEETRDEIALQVIDRASGRPVADAEVFSIEWLEHSSEGYQLHQGERGALTDWLEQHGRATRTNANGEARLPRAQASENEFPASVFARKAELWGLEDYCVADQRVILELEPERALEVHVASREGVDAAGIDVVLRSLDFFGIQFHAKTDATGLARFRHLRAFMRHDVPEPCEVTVCGLFVNSPQWHFPAQEKLPARVDLVLPPCGSVDVELLGAEGVPVTTKSDFQFLRRDDSNRVDWVFGYLQCSSPNGRTRLEWVEVGAEFDASGYAAGMPQMARALVHGPSSAGEVVSVQLKLATLPSAIYRAMDEHGAVLAKQALQVLVRDVQWDEDDSAPWEPSQTVTDDAGFFRLPLPVDDVEDSFRRMIEVLTVSREDSTTLYFHAEFSGDPSSVDVDHGDAQFRVAQRIVAGRVIDTAGAPVADAQIRVYPADDGGLDRERANRAVRQLAWMASDAQGAFEARGFCPADRVRVVANLGTQTESPPLLVPCGASDVTLTVACLGSLEGSLLLPDGVLANDVGVEWAATGATVAGVVPPRAAVRDGAEPHLARFNFYELRAGAGTLRVMVDFREFASIPDVVVSPGVSPRDPRLERIDLRDKLRVLRVFVETPDGKPVDSGGVYAPRNGDLASLDIHDHCGFIAHGVAHCVVTVAPVDLVIAVSGFRRSTRLAVAQNELRVRLSPCYEVTLEFRGAILPADATVSVITPGENPQVANVSTSGGDVATAQVRVVAQGTSRVRLELRSDQRKRAEWPIEIKDTDVRQTFVLDVDPRSLEKTDH